MDHLPTFEDIEPGVGHGQAWITEGVWLGSCVLCGALYVDRSNHVEWHQKLWLVLGGDEHVRGQ